MMLHLTHSHSLTLTHQATVGAIVPGGAADVDGRLQVGDEITYINSYSVMDAPHRNVISAMGEAAAQGEVVLKIRRKMPMPGQLLGMSLYVRTKCDRACIDHPL